MEQSLYCSTSAIPFHHIIHYATATNLIFCDINFLRGREREIKILKFVVKSKCFLSFCLQSITCLCPTSCYNCLVAILHLFEILYKISEGEGITAGECNCLVVENRGSGFETYLCLVVLIALVLHRKSWLHPNMIDKLLTGVLSLDPNKKPGLI